MRTSEKGYTLIKQFEGLQLEAYRCPAGVWTIGYGTTKNVKPGMKCDIIQATQWLHDDVAVAESAVNKLLQHDVKQCQFDALVSFVYNCGEGNFKDSTLLRRVNEGRMEDATKEFERWVYGGGKILPGLVRRRKAERMLFEGK